MDAIFTRRSIRKYTDTPVEEKLVERLLRAGMQAPSAGNEQPWEFVVLRDRETLKKITGFHRYAGMLNQAALAIVICGDQNQEVFPGYWVQDCSAATQNILLEAESQGLGAVWLGVYPVEERVKGLQELLGLPESVLPLGIVSVGYPAEKREAVDRFKPEKVHYDRW